MSIFKYITLGQLMASVEDDFHKWSDAGLIDEMKLIKVVRECNEKLGVRIYEPREAVLFVQPVPDDEGRRHKGRADLPPDFYKVEMASAVHNHFVNSMLPIGPGFTQTLRPPHLDQLQTGEITNLTGTLIGPGLPPTWLVKSPLVQLQVEIKHLIPLHIEEGFDHFTEYSPNRGHHRHEHHRHHNGFSINLHEGYLETNFLEGVIYMHYLGDMKNERGEVLIPFHPKLNEYYEWAVKARILENIMYNTEADVAGLLKDARHERNLAFNDAVMFVMGKEANEWTKRQKKREHEFFHRYYRIFY